MYLVHEELLISRLELTALQESQVTVFDTPFMAMSLRFFLVLLALFFGLLGIGLADSPNHVFGGA